LKQGLESEQLLLLLQLINQSQETNALLASFLQQQSQGKTDMKLLKTILETIRESMLDLVGKNEFSVNPVVPFGGF
jgi:hypothetical protein